MPRAEFGVSERDRTVRTPEKDAGPAVIAIRVREERHLRLLLKGEREQGLKKKKKKNIFRLEDFAVQVDGLRFTSSPRF